MRAPGAPTARKIPLPFAVRNGGALPSKPGPKRWQPAAALAVLFLAGYLGGIIAGRLQVTELGSLAANYYRQGQNFTSFLQVLPGALGGMFLQATGVLLCSFSAWGPAMLAAFFLAKGCLLGLCAAGAFVAGGARALVIHWLLTCLPDTALVLFLLWLSSPAFYAGAELFRLVFSGASRKSLHSLEKTTMLRYIILLPMLAVLSALGAGLAVVVAGVLLQ